MKMRTLVLWLGALVMCGSASAQLQVSSFDTDLEGWRFDFGSAATTLTFDPAQDSTGNPLSGSMRLDMAFDATFGGDNKSAVTVDRWASPGVDLSVYTALEADIMIDPNSAFDAFGNHGYHQFAIRNTDNYNYRSEGGFNLAPATGWFTRSVPIGNFSMPIDMARALTMQLYGGPSQNITGTVTIWLDNVRFVPEPGCGTLIVMMSGLAGIARRRR